MKRAPLFKTPVFSGKKRPSSVAVSVDFSQPPGHRKKDCQIVRGRRLMSDGSRSWGGGCETTTAAVSYDGYLYKKNRSEFQQMVIQDISWQPCVC